MLSENHVIYQAQILIIFLFNWALEQFISDFATTDNGRRKILEQVRRPEPVVHGKSK